MSDERNRRRLSARASAFITLAVVWLAMSICAFAAPTWLWALSLVPLYFAGCWAGREQAFHELDREENRA
jgi:fatty acid desaturase